MVQISATTTLIAGRFRFDGEAVSRGEGQVFHAESVPDGARHWLAVVSKGSADHRIAEYWLANKATSGFAQIALCANPSDSTQDFVVSLAPESTALAARLADHPTPSGTVARWATDLAQALAACHQAEILHGSVSTEAVVFQSRKAQLLPPLFWPNSADPEPALPLNLIFAAPEQLAATPTPPEPATDTYSLGLVIAAAAAGRPLPMGTTLPEAQSLRRHAPPLWDIDPDLAAVLDQMLQPKPSDRPADLGELAQVFEGLADETAPDIPVTPKPKRIAPEPQKRTRFWPWLIGAIVIGAGAGIAFGPIPLDVLRGIILSEPEPAITTTARPDVPAPKPLLPVSPSNQPRPSLTAVPRSTPNQPGSKKLQPVPLQPLPTPDVSSPATRLPQQPPPDDTPRLAAVAVAPHTNWLSQYDLGPCAHIQITQDTLQAVSLLGFGTNPDPFVTLLLAFAADHGFEPTIALQLVSDAQCPWIDRASSGTGAVDVRLTNDTPPADMPVEIFLSGVSAPVTVRLISASGQVVQSKTINSTDQTLGFLPNALWDGAHLVAVTPANDSESDPGDVLGLGYFAPR